MDKNEILQVNLDICNLPNAQLLSDLQYIDESPNLNEKLPPRVLRGDVRHSSLKSKDISRKKLCRHNSEKILRPGSDSKSRKSSTTSNSSRNGKIKVRRSVSAVESKKCNFKPRVKRSISDRTSSKHLLPPSHVSWSRQNSYTFDVSEGHSSSRCSRASSARTVASHASITEIVAFELGFKDIPGLTAKEARRRRVVFTVAVVSFTLLAICVLLVVLTLPLSPAVDDVLRKENEEIYRVMANIPSTAAPTAGSSTVGNDNLTSTGQPG